LKNSCYPSIFTRSVTICLLFDLASCVLHQGAAFFTLHSSFFVFHSERQLGIDGAKIRQRHCGLKFLSNFFQKFFFEGGQIGQGQIGQIENRMSFSAHNNNKILFYYILWHFLPCGNEFDQNDHDQNDRKTISISLWLSAAKC